MDCLCRKDRIGKAPFCRPHAKAYRSTLAVPIQIVLSNISVILHWPLQPSGVSLTLSGGLILLQIHWPILG
jgi:hypothetical protein